MSDPKVMPFRRGQVSGIENRSGRERAPTLAQSTHASGVPELAELPEPPAELTLAERETWQRVGALLLADGLLRASSLETLTIYARNEERLKTLRATIAERGEVYVRADGHLVTNPAARLLTALQFQQLSLQRMLGFAPSVGVYLRQAKGRELTPPTPAPENQSFQF